MIEKFLEFEKENKLLEKEYENIYYWCLIRFNLYQEMLEKKSDYGKSHTSTQDLGWQIKLKNNTNKIFNLIRKNPLLKIEPADILVLNHSRKVKVNNTYHCLYTDNLIEKLDKSVVILEEPYLDKHFKTPNSDITYFTDYITLLSKLRARTTKQNDDLILIKNNMEGIIKNINHEFNVDLNEKKWGQIVILKLLEFKYAYPYYEKIMKKVKPKVIIEVVSYKISRYIINDIANKNGVPTIELQHGNMGDKHIAYNFTGHVNTKILPNYYFLFGNFWKDKSLLPVNVDKIKVVGWPYFEKKVLINKNKTKNLNKNNKVNILFLSQGTIGKELSKVAVEMSQRLDNKKYNIIYKLHPGEYDKWNTRYPWLNSDDIRVVDNNEQDIHFYFSQTDIQIGVYSTALYEGLGYKLKTFIYSINGCENIEELIDSGIVTLFKDANELVTKLMAEKNQKEKYQSDLFWEQDSLNKIIKEIHILIEQNSEVRNS